MSKFQSQKEQIVTICRTLLERGYLKLGKQEFRFEARR